MKIELHLSLIDAVRLHDALLDAENYGRDHANLLGYVRQMAHKAIAQVEADATAYNHAPIAEEIAMARAGQRIHAIKAIRTRVPGISLREAKEAIDRAVPTPTHGPSAWVDPHH